MAALVIISGGPASGKTATAQAIASGLREAGMHVVVVSEEGPPSVAYADPPAEKQTRGALRSAVNRALSSSRAPPAVIVDGCNSVKGFRYELWCLGRTARARYCCVSCPEPGSSSSPSTSPSTISTSADFQSDSKPSSSSKSKSFVGRWPRLLFEDLASRVEPPDPRNRWEQPLFLADARRPETEVTATIGGGRRERGSVRPAPASLPAGGQGSSVEETRGWPLDAVVAAVVAAVGPVSSSSSNRSKTNDGDGDDKKAATKKTLGGNTGDYNDDGYERHQEEPETLPLATTSIALRPAKCTLTARVAGADALGDLDAAAQAVLLAVATAAKSAARATTAISSSPSTAAAAASGVLGTTAMTTATSDSTSFAAIEIPLPGSDEEERGEKGAMSSGQQRQQQEEPLTLSLRRAPSLAELRRHKRDFLRAATAPMAGPLPSGMRAGASAFCEYLKRRVV